MPDSSSHDRTAFTVPSSGTQSWNDYVSEFRASAHQTVEWIASFLENTREHPVLPSVKPGELVDSLPLTGPAEGETLAKILAEFDSKVMPAVTQWNHPG